MRFEPFQSESARPVRSAHIICDECGIDQKAEVSEYDLAVIGPSPRRAELYEHALAVADDEMFAKGCKHSRSVEMDIILERALDE